MGTILSLTCTCGYRKDELLDGTGYLCTVRLMVCEACREVVAVLLSSHEFANPLKVIEAYEQRCPKCQRTDLHRWGEELERAKDWQDEAGEFPWDFHPEDQWNEPRGCPRCGGTIRVHVVGNWD